MSECETDGCENESSIIAETKVGGEVLAEKHLCEDCVLQGWFVDE